MSNRSCTVKISSLSKTDHKCFSEKEGDWIVFRCPICTDYERRIHTKTGEMRTEGIVGNPHTHNGLYIKPGFDTNQYTPN